MERNLNHNFCVYCHTSPSGRRYVGISINPIRRWNNGKGYSKNYIFYRAIKKYGWDNITHEILYENLTQEEAETIEAKLIAQWKLTDRQYGYNLQEGGHNGSFCKESRQLMSQRRKGNNYCEGRVLDNDTKKRISDSLKQYYETHRASFYGKHHTEESIAKLKSRKFSEQTKKRMSENHYDCSGDKNPSAKPIRMYSMEGQLIKEYPYAKLASQENNCDLSSIIKCCKGKAKSCGGYRWEYKT